MKESEALATALVGRLVEKGLMLATAESCTGGWIAKAVTDVAGSSGCFGYGIVSYSNDAKQRLLNVSHALLAEHGAVSEPVVRAMAGGALRISDADVAVAVSGIAGPGGGTADKPVGTVWLACTLRGQEGPETQAECLHFEGERRDVREQTVLHALRVLLDLVHE
jgi:nicotinamide-nucleotide amidase